MEANDEAVAQELTRLVETCRKHGAWIHDDVTFDVSGGDITLHRSTASEGRERLIHMPASLMPALDEFEFEMRGNAISFTPRPEASVVHTEIMSLIVSIYNKANKVGQWRERFFLTALTEADKGIADKLQSLKPMQGKLKKYTEMRKSGKLDELAMESFFGSRLFRLSGPLMKASGRGDGPAKQVFLPVIDFINHNTSAGGFGMANDPQDGPSMNIVAASPEPNSEIFVRYNVFDPVDTFMFYGFVDKTAPWLASVPMTINVPNGRAVRVVNSGAARKKEPPKAFSDIRAYLPVIQPRRDGSLMVSRLFIPGKQAPRALRRVLSLIVRAASEASTRPEVMKAVLAVENAIVVKNLEWWTNFRTEIDAMSESPMKQSLVELCDTSADHLKAYRAHHARQGGGAGKAMAAN